MKDTIQLKANNGCLQWVIFAIIAAIFYWLLGS